MRKSLERVLFMCVGGVLVLLGGTFLPQSKQVNAQNSSEQVIDTIMCRKLKVIDSFGQVRVGLGSDEIGGFVIIAGKDKRGNSVPVITIKENDLGGTISILGKGGKSAASLTIQESLPGKHGGLVIVKNNHSPRHAINGGAYIYADEQGGGVAIHNNDGRLVGQFGITGAGTGMLETRDKSGNLIRSLP